MNIAMSCVLLQQLLIPQMGVKKMLILRRKKNESLLIGDNIRITIIECAGDGVRLAIDAPKQVSILREELSEAEQSNKNALTPDMNSIRMFQSIFKKRTEADAEAADSGSEDQS